MWEAISSFLENNWVISIFAGALVTAITELWKRGTSKKSYWQKVDLANKDILNTIESFTSEKDLPNTQILISFHTSTARKYKVLLKDIYSLDKVIDDLIRKIMESNFLSYIQKIESSERLIQLKENILKPKIESNTPKEIKDIDKLQHRHNLISITSILIGLITTAFSMFIYLFKTENSPLFSISAGEIIGPVITIAAFILAVIYTIATVTETRKNRSDNNKF
ncbi:MULTISPECIES: hypothetical protein [Bacillus]|uniref:Uncharacterized protein n=1 Tax=Bacillus mycoides TaxID=1405 RepID=A0A3D9UXJ1_BACMY|nr:MULTISPECIES: hypothetical protein [Bacillus]RBP20662.1 hypothetical protein DET63_11665 [Bacillus sp. DB-2]REF33939.1 hypothetical protein DET55_111103 [Bacillus mycoides]